eukprot:SAG11_NODE_19520_length_465_cov_0.647541_2_plen_39_part_01
MLAVALHMIQSMVLAWAFRRRANYAGKDKRLRLHEVWLT